MMKNICSIGLHNPMPQALNVYRMNYDVVCTTTSWSKVYRMNTKCVTTASWSHNIHEINFTYITKKHYGKKSRIHQT